MPKPDPAAKALVEAALELHGRRLWLEVEPDSPFLVRLPGIADPLAVVLTGHQGNEYGFFSFRGPRAFADVRRVILGGGEPEDWDPADILSLSVEPLSGITPEFRAPLQAAGFQGRRERLAPWLIAKPPHRGSRTPNPSQYRTLAMLIRAILVAHDTGEIPAEPCDERRRRILELRVEGTWRSLQVAARFVPWPEDAATWAREKIDLPPDLALLPHLDETWLLDLLLIPSGPDPRDPTIRALVLAVESPLDILAVDLIESDRREPLASLFATVCQGEGRRATRGLPRVVRLASAALHEILGPALQSLDVAVELVDDLGIFDALMDRLAPIAEAADPGLTLIPHEPKTLEEWKAADLELTRRLAGDIRRLELDTSRAVSRYFGSEGAADEVVERLPDLNPWFSFATWLLAYYRPSKKSLSHLEKLLRGKRLSPTERLLIEARLNARVSIYRIDSTEPGLSLDVEDILTGARYTVHDRALSGCDVVGRFLPLSVVPVGEWTFAWILGPPLTTFLIRDALDYLQELGVELTPEGLRQNTHCLGRLWMYGLEYGSRRPILQNTDGDPLLPHTATFRVLDPAALRRQLDSRDDVMFDDEDGTWTWSREGGAVPGMGDRTSLAHLEILDDRLVVSVNSERRLARVRSWLEEIAGVTFERVTTHELEREKRPLDDRLASRRERPFPQEAVAGVAEMYHAHCMGWLDLSIPLFGGRTPRQVASTPSGRAEVARMIRTMPAMKYPGGSVHAPREAMLRELGIEDAGS